MSNAIITASTTVPTNTAIPGSAQSLVDFIAQYLSVTFDKPYALFNYGNSTPSSGTQDRPWFKLDGNGRPLGWYVYYNGNWRRELPDPVGTIRFYTGVSAGVFDSTGLGVVGGTQDGWALANGQNGTVNLSNKFIRGGTTYTSGPGWTTVVNGAPVTAGGSDSIVLTGNQIPAHTHQLKFSIGGFSTGGSSAMVPNATANYSTLNQGRYESGGGSTDADATFVVPAFLALAPVQCIGYT